MTHSAVVNKINTVPQARELALSLSPRYTHETSPAFASGKVIGYFVRLTKKDHRGVTVKQAILRDEEAKDFLQAVSLAKGDRQVQWLIGTYIGELG